MNYRKSPHSSLATKLWYSSFLLVDPFVYPQPMMVMLRRMYAGSVCNSHKWSSASFILDCAIARSLSISKTGGGEKGWWRNSDQHSTELMSLKPVLESSFHLSERVFEWLLTPSNNCSTIFRSNLCFNDIIFLSPHHTLAREWWQSNDCGLCWMRASTIRCVASRCHMEPIPEEKIEFCWGEDWEISRDHLRAPVCWYTVAGSCDIALWIYPTYCWGHHAWTSKDEEGSTIFQDTYQDPQFVVSAR